MIDGDIIPYVDTCIQLDNTITIKPDIYTLDNAVNDIYMRTKCLMCDFSFLIILTYLFNTYCMHILYGCPLWKYDRKILKVLFAA